jgi:hypothetical protein
MVAPINVKLENPTVNVRNWDSEAKQWMELNQEVGGNPDFYPLTIKAAFVVGVIHDICQSVSHLLIHRNVKNTTYLPAYGVCSSGIEILGRCVNGNSSSHGAVSDLKTGFKWLVSSDVDNISDDYELITTSQGSYSINQMSFLRHYAAHGQATAHEVKIDYEILGAMHPLVAKGLGRYWNELIQSENRCNDLAQANIIPLRGWPVKKSWILFERDRFGKYHSVEEIFNRFKWNIK